MIFVRNNLIKLMNLKRFNQLISNNLTYRSTRLFFSQPILFNEKKVFTADVLNESKLAKMPPTVIKTSIFNKILMKMGFRGDLKYSQPILKIATFNLYLCLQYQIDYDMFFKKFDAPDVFYSYCLINFLHVWLLSVPLAQLGPTGLHMQKLLYSNMWQDIEARAKKIGASMNKENKFKAYTTINDTFRTLLVAMDEGLLGDDTTLANAIWTMIMENKEITDYSVLRETCEYIRKNINHLESINETDYMRHGVISLVGYDQIAIDHSKVRELLIEKLKKRQTEE